MTETRLEDVRAVFARFLKERKQRQTAERFAVLDAIYQTEGHVDADELYHGLQASGVQVSRATVYNTLDLLIECDLVARHQFGAKGAKYERAYSYWQHDHLICLDCEALFEFCDPRIQGIQEMIGEIFEMKVAQHSLTLYAHCAREGCPRRPVKSV